MNDQNVQHVNIHTLAERFKSKKEFYRFLQQNCKAYLPKITSANIYFFKQVLSGKKKLIVYKQGLIKVSSAPQIEGLTVNDFLQYARQNQEILRYLPDERDWVHLERQWISDIIYTIDTQQFQNFIDNAILERQKKMEQQQNLSVEIKPEFLQALNECKQFSCNLFQFFLQVYLDGKGRSIFMIKDSSKRKRTRIEIDEVKNEEEKLNENKQEYLREHKRLKIEKEQLQNQLQYQNQAQSLLNQLEEAGIINEAGEILLEQQFQI